MRWIARWPLFLKVDRMKRFALTSLNLNGIRSAATKGLEAWAARQAPDCICVQEVKAQAADIAGMKGYFQFAEKKGYSGVGVYSRFEPSDVVIGFTDPLGKNRADEFNAEGRYVEARFDQAGQKFSVISCYFPSGSSGEDRQQAKFRFLAVMHDHLAALMEERDFVLCGDVNIAHREQDLKNYKSNAKNSGFLPEERAWMTTHLQTPQGEAEEGLIDVYRTLHPDTTEECYTWWSQRGAAYDKNVGWRLDYHLATPAVAAWAKSVSIDRAARLSDHAPVTVTYEGL
jgi:exodeoxyribonuclease III